MKALLFDFGGTLDTNGVHWSEKFWDVYSKCNVPFSKKEFERAYVEAEPAMNSGIIAASDGLLTTLEKQITLQWNLLAQSHNEIKPNDRTMISRIAGECFFEVRETVGSIQPLLYSCQKKYLLGIVSHFYGNLTAVCRELCIDIYFHSFIDSAVVGARKPDPKIFQLAIDSLHALPAETYVVGDSYDRDIVPAKTIGCVAIWLCGQSWNRPGDTSCADYVISSLDELKTLLRLP
jgi:putative hydrolase of the HAD superfamily